MKGSIDKEDVRFKDLWVQREGDCLRAFHTSAEQ